MDQSLYATTERPKYTKDLMAYLVDQEHKALHEKIIQSLAPPTQLHQADSQIKAVQRRKM